MGAIGVVNLQQILLESKKASEKNVPVESQANQYNEQFETLRRELMQTQAKLKDRGAKMAASERFELQRELDAKQRELNYRQEDARAHMEMLRQQVLSTVTADLDALLAALAKERSMEIVLTIPNAAVAFAANSVDLTAALIEQYDAA